MEEEKAAAYYDELTRKGVGAARFKQGLGFSSATIASTTTSDEPPIRGSALPSSSSFLSNFVRASSPTKETEIDRKKQLENIQNKLKKKESKTSIDAPFEKIRVRDCPNSRNSRRSRSRERDREKERGRDKDSRRGRSRSRSRSRSRRRRGGSGSDEERGRLRRRYRGSSKERRRERSRERRRERSRERRGRRSRDRSYSDDERRCGRRNKRSRSRSFSPRDGRRSEKGREGGGKDGRMVKKGNGVVDYALLIDGYDKMTPAERIKAKMKLQLTQTAEKDTKMGTSSQWERFDFNKDAPVDDEEIEAADDDAALVKHIGKSFRFTSFEAKSEDKIKNAHDEAMFGVPASGTFYALESGEERGSEKEKENEDIKNDDSASSFINAKVLSKQQGSWRDRARRNVG